MILLYFVARVNIIVFETEVLREYGVAFCVFFYLSFDFRAIFFKKTGSLVFSGFFWSVFGFRFFVETASRYLFLHVNTGWHDPGSCKLLIINFAADIHIIFQYYARVYHYTCSVQSKENV